MQYYSRADYVPGSITSFEMNRVDGYLTGLGLVLIPPLLEPTVWVYRSGRVRSKFKLKDLATVITNLFSAIPWIGKDLVELDQNIKQKRLETIGGST